MMRGAILTGVVLLGSVALTGCGDEESGDPQGSGGQPPGTSVTGGSVPGLPHSGAPKVTTPIADTSRWEADPCGVISEDLFTDAGFTIRRSVPNMNAPAGINCRWAIDGGGSVAGTFITKSPTGLSGIYSNNNQTPLEHFQPIAPIEGQPAVEAMEFDTPTDGACAISIGLRDDLTYKVHLIADKDSPLAAEPCKWAATIAGLAVRNMKQGG